MTAPISGRWIIISNGRCGSTLLSDLIADHPDTLSVQEFFMSTVPATKSDAVLAGAEYWALLSSPKPDLAALFRIGLLPREVRYPADGRWAGELTALPGILAVTLSKISDDPDALFDALAARVPGFPRQPVGRHHEMFLDLLTVLTGRRRWVERSGGSSYLAPYLLRAFPDAGFVYLTRNTPDTARSMSRHSSFQMIQLRAEFLGRCGVDPFYAEPEAVPADLAPLLPDRLTAAALRERGQDVRRYLWLCAFLTNQVEQALADVAPRRLLTMRYEDLVARPVEELGRLGRFLEFADWAGWADVASERVVAPAPGTRHQIEGGATVS
ncbi:hypothetical protein [Plantactinospora sp. KLBMP9567]|uniref:hypothetical protein n=1 Tax=Plantactinospora sp. KLBMP9567 TaxID=3085900 RepID=UPI00298106E7|nr:hypothetical protein [Plantactinospora sp. KLBMP9567]MDW5324345.1 hypothetical protein [Plantactinospora sp. KLBMP9567]